MNINNLSIGHELPTLEKNPTRAQLFRYSAITWNPHRIHYDPEFATEVEGHPNILVQAHFHGAAIQELVMDWLGTDGELTAIEWENVGRATPDDSLTVGGEITEISEAEGIVKLEAWTKTSNGPAAEGSARVQFFE